MTLLRTIVLSLVGLYPLFAPAAQDGWQASAAAIAKSEKERPGINFREENVPAYTLPPLLVSPGGRAIKTADEWNRIRRGELIHLFQEEIYGVAPDKPATMRFVRRAEDSKAMNGLATMKQVAIEIVEKEKTFVINVVLFLPNRRKEPAPLFLLINNRAPSSTDPTRAVRTEFWPAEEVIARGYGIAAFHVADVVADKSDGFTSGVFAIYDAKHGADRPANAWGALAAWAWGASRVMDYIQTDSTIDKTKVALVGHSRGGKTALWAGATDDRFALVVSNESGSAGAMLGLRMLGSTVAYRYKVFPYWWNRNYSKYIDNDARSPFDQHMLLALIAPRALYVTCADEDLAGDPRGTYLALWHAMPAYRLFMPKVDLPEAMPPLNTPVRSGKVGYHIRTGEHGMTLYDWKCFMDFADGIFVAPRGSSTP